MMTLNHNTTVAAAAGAALMLLAYQYWSNLELKSALKNEKEKREADRRGRIKSEQKLREKKQQNQLLDGHVMKYIGHVQSPFPDRRGTPRQPLLVPSAHGRIVFDKTIVSADHFQELSQFSHVWIVFVFHENTNVNANHDHLNKTCTAKVAPPRLKGKKVGCLSTRSPHRCVHDFMCVLRSAVNAENFSTT